MGDCQFFRILEDVLLYALTRNHTHKLDAGEILTNSENYELPNLQYNSPKMADASHQQPSRYPISNWLYRQEENVT